MEKSITEAECNALENTFHQIIANMKMSFPAVEDLTGKALKLNAVLRTTISATSAFLEAFQKVANLALGSKGSTNEIGTMLIRLCLRHRAIEEKLKQFTSSLTEGLVTPLQERLEEWKKAVIVLDKDHAKESKKAHQDIKKALSETIRLKKKSKKPAKPETAKQLEHAVNEYNEKCEVLEVIEKNAVRSALAEEHNCFCYFVQCLKPVMDCEVSMMAEMTQVELLMSALQAQSFDPVSCPDKGSNLEKDAKKQVSAVSPQGDGESPNVSHGSRKSSIGSSSSSCVPSPLHVSVPCSTPHSKDKIHESQDDGITVISPSSSNQTQSLTIWSNCQEQTRTIPRMSTSSEISTTPLSEDQLKAEHQAARDSPSSRETVCANQYAVPYVVGTEITDSASCVGAVDVYAKPSVPDEQQVSMQRKSVDGTAVPLEGYVNMSQLACLAVQQQELKLKKEMRDESDCPDLPPPPPESLTDNAISSDTPETSSVTRNTGSGITSRTAEDILLSGEFEVFADSVLESFYGHFPGSNFNSLPRNINGEIAASMHAPFKYTAAQRFVFGAATIRRTPMRDRSLPPISRKSSKTALLPLQNDAGQKFPTNDPVPFSPLYGKEYRKRIEEIYEKHMDAFPLPPPPPSAEVHSISAVDDNAVDDLPLPPPPEELRDFGFCPQRIRKAGSSELLGGKRHRSVVSSHAGIIESLSVRFSETQTLPREAAAANFARGRRASDAMCIEDIKSRNEPTVGKFN